MPAGNFTIGGWTAGSLVPSVSRGSALPAGVTPAASSSSANPYAGLLSAILGSNLGLSQQGAPPSTRSLAVDAGTAALLGAKAQAVQTPLNVLGTLQDYITHSYGWDYTPGIGFSPTAQRMGQVSPSGHISGMSDYEQRQLDQANLLNSVLFGTGVQNTQSYLGNTAVSAAKAPVIPQGSPQQQQWGPVSAGWNSGSSGWGRASSMGLMGQGV
jgi:hypothetical protein